MDTHELYSWLRRRDVIDTSAHREDEQEQSELHQPLLRSVEDQLPQGSGLLPADHDEDHAPQVHAPLNDQRSVVQRHMPPSLSMFAGKQSLIRDGLYTYLDRSGHAQRAKRTTPSKKYMLPILDGLRNLDTLLDAPFNINDEKPIQDCFHSIIVACEHYLENRNPWTREGKARKQMIQDFYEQVKFESIGFAGIVDNMRRGAFGAAAPNTWIEVLSQVRTQTFADGQPGVRITEGGAATSKLYIVEKNGVKRYFKQNEQLPPESYDENLEEEKARLRRENDLYQASAHTQAEKAAYSDRVNRRLRGLSLIRKYLFRECRDDENTVFSFLCHHADKNDLLQEMVNRFSRHHEFATFIDPLVQERDRLIGELNQIKADYTAATDAAARQTQKDLYDAKYKEYKDCDLEYLHSAVIQIKKDMLAHAIAVHDAKVAPSSELSKRNVATSRMARLLGLDGMIVSSQMAEVEINGNRMRGIIMDEAPGKPAPDIDEAHRRPVMYSSNAFRQLLNLQVFDIICGQVDRHMGNYVCQEDASQRTHIGLTSIIGIDNDMSFGTLTYKDISERGTQGLNRMRNIEIDGNLYAPFIDYDLYERLRNITEEQINYEMCDILSKEERKALFDRIKGVQTAFEKRMKYESKNSRKPGFVCRFIGKPGNPITWDMAHSDYKTQIATLRRQCIAHGNAEEQRLLNSLALRRADMSLATYNMEEANIIAQCDEIRADTDQSLSDVTYLYGPYLTT
jgi:hypothetical protein